MPSSNLILMAALITRTAADMATMTGLISMAEASVGEDGGG